MIGSISALLGKSASLKQAVLNLTWYGVRSTPVATARTDSTSFGHLIRDLTDTSGSFESLVL